MAKLHFPEDLPEEVITSIQEYAGLYFTDREIARICEIHYSRFRVMADDSEHPVAQALDRGRLLSSAKVRKSIIDLATQGSKDAQQMASEMMENLNIDNQEL